MGFEVSILEVPLRSFGEMLAETLRNEGIDAYLMGTSFLNTAYLAEAGILDRDGTGWRLMVPLDQEKRAREILDELQDAGELVESDFEDTDDSDEYPPT